MHAGSFERLKSALSRGALVLTANARLTRHIVSEYDRAMRLSGLTAWPTPQVMPFSSWAAGLWDEYGDGPALSGLRGRALWERIAGQDPASSGAWPASGIARLSYEAFRLLREHFIELPADDIYLTEESKALRRWQAEYLSELKRLGFAAEADLPANAARLVDRGAPVPAEVILAGFDELSPAASALAGAIGRRSALSFWPGPEETAPARQAWACQCADEEDEVTRAARWARKVYRPGMKVGFIVPDLGRYRALIEREFASELDPASALPGAQASPVFNISLGLPLADEPLVASAIDLLSIGNGHEKTDQLMRALRSPFMAGADHRGFAELDCRLRNDNRLEARLAGLVSMLPEGASRRVGEWLSCLRGQPRRLSPGEWARAFTTLLERAGWTRSVSLTSREHQALLAWNRALEALASLDDIVGRISRAEALSHISFIARDTIHQVETPEADLQVLGLLESTGLWFDCARVIGCHQGALPGEPSPNPFIPAYIQRQRRLPRSSAEVQLEFARVVAKRLLSSAPETVVSWPAVSEDRERGISPLFSGLPVRDEGELPSSRLVDMEAGGLEDAPVEGPLPVADAEMGAIRGGTSIIKNQSMCPFRAFALHRLRARPLPETGLDLPPRARGDIVHNALRLLWEEVGSSTRLGEMKAAGAVEGLVDRIVAKAMADARVPEPLSKRFIDLERKRLSELVTEWVEVELSRQTGFRVSTIELEKEIVIGGLSIKGRIDRIDELDGGGQAIFDYKTGRTGRGDWLTGRPMDPQLIVYSAGAGFNAVSFAQVRPGECRFVGISRDEALPGIKPYDDDGRFRNRADGRDWDALMAFWKETVESLAKDFLAGKNEVDPNNGTGERACRHCELPLLCRYAGAADAGEDEEGNGGGGDGQDA